MTLNTSIGFTAKSSIIVAGAINAKTCTRIFLPITFKINYAYPMFPDARDPLVVLPGSQIF